MAGQPGRTRRIPDEAAGFARGPRVLTPARILIVQDDRLVSRGVEAQLTAIGHTVVGMTSRGDDVLARTLDSRADLVLMDVHLEGPVDGIAAAQQLRDHCRVPVVFLSAQADKATIKRASRTEPFAYLLKPFDDMQLVTAIEVALHKHGAEQRLRASERRFATTLASIGEAVISTNEQAVVTFLNHVAASMTGWPGEDAIGRHVSEVFHVIDEETGERLPDPAREALQSGRSVRLPDGAMLLARDGKRIPIRDSASPIIDDAGARTGAVLVFSDITASRAAEQALHKAQSDLAHAARMTNLGELAGTIAHEVNQPLMALTTNADACMRWLAAPVPDIAQARCAAQRVVRNGHRAAAIVKNIQALALHAAPAMAPLEIRATIQGVLNLTRDELHRNQVQLQTDFAADLPLVTGNRVLLQQVVLNLVVNAIEAVAGLAGRPRNITIATQPQGPGHVMVAVADTGRGIPPSHKERIFDPLFTTKPNGLGLGLSICRSIVETHRGRLWAHDGDPFGSVFLFTLPVAHHDPHALAAH